MWFTIGFGAACAFGAYCYVSWLLPAALLFALLAVLFLVITHWNKLFRISCAVCLGIAVGLTCFYFYDDTVLKSARAVDGKTEWVTIEVSDYSYRTDYGSAFDGMVTIDGRTFHVCVYLNTFERLEPGHRVRGSFCFHMTFGHEEDSLNEAGTGNFLFAIQDGVCTPQKYWRPALIHYPAIWRHQLKTVINKSFPEDVEGFARALLLGDRSGIDYETNTAMKISGISHVIAVSGLHVSILFGLIYLISGRRRIMTALIGIPAVILFVAIAGFTPSITRAGIMQIVMMLAMLLEKEYDPPTALSFAALIMTIANPVVIASVSFQLSVGCMAGIFLFGEQIRSWLMASSRFGCRKGKLTNWLSSSIAVTLSAMTFTTPLTAIYFGTVSLIGIVTNLITLWVITFTFYGIMLICAIGFVSLVPAKALAGVLAWAIRYVLAAAAVMSSVPLAAVYTKSIYIVLWLEFAYVLLSVYLFIRKKPAVLFMGLLICGFCGAVALSWVEPLLGECRVTVLDVGQGQAILLQSEGKTFLVDCGGSYSESAADTAAETLLSQGIRKLDGIILTHYDADHSGGIPYLLTRIGTENLFLPYAEDPYAVAQTLRSKTDGAVFTVKEDMLLSYGSVKITIFAPVSFNSGNESSMCVLFQTENCDILITGDRSVKTEQMLLSRRDLPQLEVLVVGHHGSKTSTCEQLLEETRPEYAFISVGEKNPYGHPAQEILDRLLEYGCIICRTDENGTIIFRR